MKIALITGITGQDGSYLAELLLNKGYKVHGIKRRSSSFNTDRIDKIYSEFSSDKFCLHYGDLLDATSIGSLVSEIRPHEIYNLAAQSHVAVSFDMPEYTAEVNAVGTIRLLEAIRRGGLVHHTKFYQASTSELFGNVQQIPQTEQTPFYPRSPYAVSKLFSYWSVVNYREAYGMFACNGILFNHESPRRGETFVTRKITRQLTRIVAGLDECLFLGNLDAMRDWGHARDFVKMQWMMLQQENPKDYVIATGQQLSVREFVVRVCNYLGLEIQWRGSGLAEEAYVTSNENKQAQSTIPVGKVIVKVDERLYRPTEVETLLGDPTKAREELGWQLETSIDELITEMVDADLEKAKLLQVNEVIRHND